MEEALLSPIVTPKVGCFGAFSRLLSVNAACPDLIFCMVELPIPSKDCNAWTQTSFPSRCISGLRFWYLLGGLKSSASDASRTLSSSELAAKTSVVSTLDASKREPWSESLFCSRSASASEQLSWPEVETEKRSLQLNSCRTAFSLVNSVGALGKQMFGCYCWWLKPKEIPTLANNDHSIQNLRRTRQPSTRMYRL